MNKVTYAKVLKADDKRFDNHTVKVNGNVIGTIGWVTTNKLKVQFYPHGNTNQYKHLEGMECTDMESMRIQLTKRLK